MENNQEPLEQNPSVEEPLEQLSITDAITGVLTGPGETFETMVSTKKKNYWVIPVLLSIVIGIVVTFIFFRDAQLMSGIMDKQKAQLEKRMDEQVKSGKMSPEQSKQATEQAEKFMDPKSTFFQIMGYGGVVLVPFLMLFVLSLVYLLSLKAFKADVDFGNLLNVVGLPLVITTIGSIISLVLSIVMGTVSTLSPALILNEGMVGVKMAEFFTKIDLISIWYYFAVAAGLSKAAKISSGKSYGIVYGVWIFWIVITSAFSFIF
ncbi:MAG: YIP1 family protein [Ignavibacteriae bacterium]|nr:YIP1 family protein [Ignavibacteriota bacterium]